MEKIKLLQINKLYYPTTGGIERVVQQIAEGLDNKVDMQVLVCKEKGRNTTENINGIKVERAGSLGVIFSVPLSFSFFGKFFKLSKNNDIIQFHMPFPLGDLACLLSGYKGKVVIWWHSDIVRQKKLMLFYRPLMKKFLKRADAIIVATEGHIYGSDYLFPYKDKCVIIPFGVENKILDKANHWISNQNYYNEKQKTKLRFLFVGRFVYYKGCKVLIEAFSRINDEVELILVGQGKMEEELKIMIKKLGLDDSVTIKGNLSDEQLAKEFSLCDVFVLPSIEKSEAFGLVQIEAMAYGKPVINTNLQSGVPYVSLDNITGLTVSPGNVEELADAMSWMVKNEEERIRMGIRARKRVLEEYQTDKMLNRLMDLYNNLTQRVLL